MQLHFIIKYLLHLPSALFISVLLQIHYYDRLSPLKPLEEPIGSFLNVKRGDCIVTFSRREIYKYKVR